jgi:iron complex transport system ATP-binding protein
MSMREFIGSGDLGHKAKPVPGAPLIDVDRLSFGYSESEPVIEDISFKVDRPEFLCIVGPNGVGKSTLVRCITGSLKPTEGEVMVRGNPVRNYSLRELSRLIGYVPVSTEDYNAMTVLDTVLVGMYSKQKWRTTKADIDKSYRALASMQVEDLAMNRFNELSAGQHQKVSLARGIVQEPEALILDEPTSNLDPRHQVYVSAFFKELSRRKGTSVIMISHDLNIAAKYADRLLVLRKPGVLYGIGTPREIISEKMVRDIYNVDCTIVEDRGTPHVILEDVIF